MRLAAGKNGLFFQGEGLDSMTEISGHEMGRIIGCDVFEFPIYIGDKCMVEDML